VKGKGKRQNPNPRRMWGRNRIGGDGKEGNGQGEEATARWARCIYKGKPGLTGGGRREEVEQEGEFWPRVAWDGGWERETGCHGSTLVRGADASSRAHLPALIAREACA
jgi:hypothetical protein